MSPLNFRSGHNSARSLFVLMLFVSGALSSQSTNASCVDIISADRPGFSTGTNVLAPGCQGIEVGVQTTHDSETSTRDITSPLLLYRVGIGERWELRAAWDGISWTNMAGSHERAANDSNIGIKYRLFEGSEWTVSLLGAVSLPTGSRALSSKAYDPLLGLLWNLDLDDNNSFSGTVQTASLSDSGDRIQESQVMRVSLRAVFCIACSSRDADNIAERRLSARHCLSLQRRQDSTVG